MIYEAEILATLQEIRDQHKPINSVAELRKVAGITDNKHEIWQQAVKAKMVHVGLGELAEALAKQRGFSNVDAMLAFDQREKEKNTKPDLRAQQDELRRSRGKAI